MKWSILIPALAASLLVAQTVCAEEPAGGTREPVLIEVELGAGTFSVRAEEAPLNEILYSLALEAGFPVTEHNVAWREGMAQLLRGWNYALVMDSLSESPTELIVIARDEGEAPQVAVYSDSSVAVGDDEAFGELEASPETSMEEAIRIANELIVAQEDPLAAAIREVEEAGATAHKAPDDLESAKRYLEALRGLSDFQDPRLLDVLAPAIASRHSAIRSVALEVMRYNPLESDSSTLDRVYQMATSDPDPQVRRNALEVYVRYGDQNEVLSAVQALGRIDGPARDIAVREWIRIEQERSEAPLADQQIQDAMQE